MKHAETDRTLALESCLFEATAPLRMEFDYLPGARVIFRALSSQPLSEDVCGFDLCYLSIERNILHVETQAARIRNETFVNPLAVGAREFNLEVASTLILPLSRVVGAHSVIVVWRGGARSPIFLRRDTIRVEGLNKKEDVAPAHSVLLSIAPLAKPEFLAHAPAGRAVFGSRSCIGAKGLIVTVTALDRKGRKTAREIALAARLASLGADAIVVPRARRLERPERFNKEIGLPADAAYVRGAIMTIAQDAESHYDIMGLKFSRYRHAVGIPSGVALFEQVSLQLHQEALTRSREEFIALMQND